MKTVFSKSADVCAVWAAQTQPEARNGSSVRFKGLSLYSYGTEIGRIVARTASGGGSVALVSSNQWSSGTSKVQGEARAAAKLAFLAVYTVPWLGNDFDAIEANLKHYEAEIAAAIEAIIKAVRWDTAAQHRATALRLIGTASLFAAEFKTSWHWRGLNPLAVLNQKEEF